MSLFEVKGWDVPTQATTVTSSSQQSRKRKRPANDADKMQTAQVNVEKLMRKVFEQGDLEPKMESRKEHKGKRPKGKHPSSDDESRSQPRPSKKRKGKTGHEGEESAGNEYKGFRASPSHIVKKARKTVPPEPSAASRKPTAEHTSVVSTHKKKADSKAAPISGLTSLQASMKDRLGGARFRWINEVLYTSGSEEGHRLMREDPKIYEEYHTGFRQQVRSWPSNPISHYISALSLYPPGTVIADLGCGDAALARSLIPKGYCVLSFDLVSDGAFVLEADVCDRIPLPGAEDSGDDNQGQVVDVCVCALSLMSVDWIQCIRETWRILKSHGELKIAEVTSRFTDVDEFVSVITGLGFKLTSKDESNTHFTLFDFRRIARDPITEKAWGVLREKHSVLKPCEYKRR